MSSANALQTVYDNSPYVRRMALLVISLMMIIVSMSLSAINIAIPTIGADLRIDAQALSWIPTAMLWGNVVFLLPVGRLSDQYGLKRMFALGGLVFMLSSWLILLVDNLVALLAIRVFQGIAAAMIYGTGIALVSAIYANGRRGQALGLSSASVYLGLTMGPWLGGLLVVHWGWRSVMWAPGFVALAALLAFLWFVKGEWRNQQYYALDWQGFAIFAMAISFIVVGLTNIAEFAFTLLAVAGLALLVLFIWHQKDRETPLLHVRALWENKLLHRSLLAGFFVYSASFSLVFLLSLYLQYIQGLTPVVAGLVAMLQTMVMIVLAPIAGRLSDKYEARYLSTFGCGVFFIGYLMMSQVNQHTSISYVASAVLLIGAGFGFFSTPNNNAAMGSVAADRLSISGALINLSRTLGNMMSSALIMVLFSVWLGTNEITPELHPQLLRVVQWAMAVSCGYVLIAAVFSYKRGRTRSASV